MNNETEKLQAERDQAQSESERWVKRLKLLEARLQRAVSILDGIEDTRLTHEPGKEPTLLAVLLEQPGVFKAAYNDKEHWIKQYLGQKELISRQADKIAELEADLLLEQARSKRLESGIEELQAEIDEWRAKEGWD